MPQIDETIPAAGPFDFLRRALRWLAVLCLAYALLSVITYCVEIPVHGFPRYGTSIYGSRGLARAQQAVTLGGMAGIVLLLAGAWGLLGWKRWSRPVLLLGAAAMIVFSLVSSITWFAVYLHQLAAIRATTSPVANPPAWFMLWTMLANTAHYSAFPLVIIWSMLQHDVRELWAREPAGGFEVVPLAEPVCAADRYS